MAHEVADDAGNGAAGRARPLRGNRLLRWVRRSCGNRLSCGSRLSCGDRLSCRDRLSPRQRWSGAGLLLIGVLALVRAWEAARPPPDPRTLGQPIALDVEALQGEDFRLLPGVGPVLAARLEAARVAAGGRLAGRDLLRVAGVGPSLRARWESLRSR